MKKWEKSDEEFLLMHGWKKIDGFKIQAEAISEVAVDYDIFFVPIDELDEYVVRCEYWQHDDYDDVASEYPEEIIENHYEEYLDEDGNLYDEPVQK